MTIPTNITQIKRWLCNDSGDMVWQTVVLVSVLLPLASLCIDVPRYFTLRSRLQLALEGATQAAAQCVDFRHFQNVGETRLLPDCLQSESQLVFAQATQDIQSKGYQPTLGTITVDEKLDQVSGSARGYNHPFLWTVTPVRGHSRSGQFGAHGQEMSQESQVSSQKSFATTQDFGRMDS